MRTLIRIGSGVLFGGMIFLLFLVVFESFLHIPSWLAVAGRMHPMFLHFPIVLLLISFFTMWIPSGRATKDDWFVMLRLVAALSAVITAILGMLLSLEDASEGELLLWHKWGGVTIAILGFLFYSYHDFLVRHILFAKLFTLAATVGIILTGHWGANLTHGADYVLAPILKQKELAPPDKAIVFADVIQPIFESKCISCHSESKLKGELLLENLKGVLAGGKSGPLFIPGNPDTSLLMRRIHLPVDDKKRMPPASKPQLTETETALLSAWIKSGAVTESKLFSLPETDSFRVLATAYLKGDKMATDPVYDFEPADEKKVLALNNNYRIVVPLGKNSPALSVNLYGRNVYSSKTLEELLPVKQQIIELNLARLPVKDEDMKVIQQLTNLEKLNLNYTDITGKGIEQLTTLAKLRELTVAGTGVTANALEKILPLPELESVFIWDTKIDSLEIKPLQKKFSKVNIETGYVDKGDVIVALSPPIIETKQGIFNNSTSLQIKHPFKGVDIRYTLDGTTPDSVNGNLYTDPIAIDKTVTLTATAYKKGWYGSPVAQAVFIKRGMTPDSIAFLTKPDPRYSADQATLLSDGTLGDYDNHSNGEWLGYRNNEAAYEMFFNNPISPQTVLLNMLQNTRGYIFPPAKVQVWGGMDNKKLQLLATLHPKIPAKNEAAKPLQESINLASAEIRCLKIVIQPVNPLPAWHEGKGQRAWVFLSEIVIN